MQQESSFAIFTMEFCKKECIKGNNLFVDGHDLLNVVWFCRTRGKYGEGDKEEKFTYSLALVCSQCIINYLYARISKLFEYN